MASCTFHFFSSIVKATYLLACLLCFSCTHVHVYLADRDVNCAKYDSLVEVESVDVIAWKCCSSFLISQRSSAGTRGSRASQAPAMSSDNILDDERDVSAAPLAKR